MFSIWSVYEYQLVVKYLDRVYRYLQHQSLTNADDCLLW